MTWNPACRLRLSAIRCRAGSPCAGFRPEFFGATAMVPRYGGGYRLIYLRDVEHEAA